MSDSHLRRALVQRLESLASAGVRQAPRGVAIARSSQDAPPAPADPPATPQPAASAEAGPASAPGGQGQRLRVSQDAPTPCGAASLDVLRAEVASCTRCVELAAARTQTVFGVGHPDATLCFLGEAPGADEDRQGEPFVGRAGQLLTRIIQACGMQREEVYILNVLKCRPPGNRNPTPVEAGNCRGYLNRQLELINPQFVCCLGAVAAQNLLDTTRPIGRLRGSVHQHHQMRVVCTYHPAYLLRNPSAKRDTWEDMKLLMREMGRPIDP